MSGKTLKNPEKSQFDFHSQKTKNMIPYMIEHWYVSFLRIWQRNGILRIIWKSGKTLKKPEKSKFDFHMQKN